MALQLVCVLTVLFGANSKYESELDVSGGMVSLMYVFLLISAMTTAAGTIAVRVMRDFHESVILWYATLAMLFASMFVVSFQGVAIFYSFSALSWLLLVVNGLTANTYQISRTKAYQRGNAAKLQVLAPTTTLCVFSADLLIFHVTYTETQYIGFGALIALTLVQSLEFVFLQMPRIKAQKEQEHKERHEENQLKLKQDKEA
jgi:uncharacterized membrane protein